MNENGILDKSVPPVCIAGMHRSGTSTVAQMLYRLGLYLGREEDLFAASSANEDGFWENERFVGLNEAILRSHASGWDLPPDLEPGWQRGERLASLRDEARRLIEDFEGEEPWGWKDPRTSLTLPFWLDLLPNMKAVVCLRNPLEVANSLRKRGSASILSGLNLWKVYNERLMDTLEEGRYIVTHYESYFHRPQEELRRVVDFLGVPASDQLISLVRSRVIRGLRHHALTLEDLREFDPSGQIGELYLRMCAEAGWNPEPIAITRALADAAPLGDLPG